MSAAERPIDDLAPDPANARRLTDDRRAALGTGIDDFGDLGGIVWNERTGQLVSGHQRMRVLVPAGGETFVREGKRGWIVNQKTGERFPVRIVDWSLEKQRRANLVANNYHAQGEFEADEALEQVRLLAGTPGYDSLRLAELAEQLEAEVRAGQEEEDEGDGGGDGDGGDDEEGEDELDDLTEGFAVVVECETREEAAQAGEFLTEQGRAFRALFGAEPAPDPEELWPFEKKEAPEGVAPMRALQGDPQNPRVIDEEALQGLVASIQKFGDIGGITWNEQTGHLVTGHQRVRILRERGCTKWTRVNDDWGYLEHPGTRERFPVRIVRWDDEVAMQARYTANNPKIAGKFTTAAAAQLRAMEADEHFAALGLNHLLKELEPALKRLEAQAAAQAAEKYCLLIECASEREQRELVELVLGRGYRCRALI